MTDTEKLNIIVRYVQAEVDYGVSKALISHEHGCHAYEALNTNKERDERDAAMLQLARIIYEGFL